MHSLLLFFTLCSCHPDVVKGMYAFEYREIKQSVIKDDVYYAGVIGSEGAFEIDRKIKPIKLPAMITFSFEDYYYSHGKEKVYYYNGGKLIPGMLNNHEFTKDQNGIMVDFDDYVNTLFARRIFNLPGVFVYKKR